MKYVLSDSIALRSWHLVPYAYYVRGDQFAKGLKKEEFERLLSCDGKTEVPDDDLTRSLLSRGMVRPAHEGDTLSEWQRFRNCDNRYMPQINLQITAKCNYNCVHCFNAVDNAPLLSEMPYEDVLRLLDEAVVCGVSALTITGGEPMVHKRFMDVMRAIYERDLFVFDFNTNGHYLTQEILDEFKKIGCRPLMKISFDGIGYHDWMRGRKGAEADALRSIRLCLDNGFRVMVQYNINKKNLPSLYQTLDLLDEMGVDTIRLIRTTPAPRWEQNAAGQTFDIPEYYELALEILKKYSAGKHRAALILWQIAQMDPTRKTFSLTAVKKTGERYRDTVPLCKGTRGMIAVGAGGQVYPCMQMSGWFDEHGKDLGNVRRDGLKAILREGAYLSCVCQTVRDRIEKNGKCGDCRYLEYCMGGCPALGILGSPTGDILAPDPTKCYFYENGYYEKMTEVLRGYRNLTVMNQPDDAPDGSRNA